LGFFASRAKAVPGELDHIYIKGLLMRFSSAEDAELL
jgi:hypothetical protein